MLGVTNDSVKHYICEQILNLMELENTIKNMKNLNDIGHHSFSYITMGDEMKILSLVIITKQKLIKKTNLILEILNSSNKDKNLEQKLLLHAFNNIDNICNLDIFSYIEDDRIIKDVLVPIGFSNCSNTYIKYLLR